MTANLIPAAPTTQHHWPASPAGRCEAIGLELDQHGPRLVILRAGGKPLTRGHVQQLRTAGPDVLASPGVVALASLHPDTLTPDTSPVILALTGPGDLITIAGPGTTPEATTHAHTLDATLPRLLLDQWEAHPTPTEAQA